jgi:hypothetical protein
MERLIAYYRGRVADPTCPIREHFAYLIELLRVK